MNMRWAHSVLMILVSLFAGVGFGYFGPRCVAGKPDSAWIPLTFGESMEVTTGAMHRVIPRAPRFLSEGDHSVSGQAKFSHLAGDDDGSVRLGYTVNLTPPPIQARLGNARLRTPGCSTYDVRFSFTLLDADGLQLQYLRSDPYILNLGESCSFQGVLDQPVRSDLADLIKSIDCRLCFEGIEIP
jgi:hypothetical protein